MILVIVQARQGSIRLPNKVLKKVNGKPIISILLHRLSLAKRVDKIILATSKNRNNDQLTDVVEKLGIEVYRGSENDVLDRYYMAAKKYRASCIVRVTGDCPIIDPGLVDATIKLFKETDVDFANVQPPIFPDGLDVSVFTFNALETSWKHATTKYDREHVDSFIMNRSQFKKINLTSDGDYSKERWTLDFPEDFEVISRIIEHFTPDLDFTWKDVLRLRESHPEYFEPNQGLKKSDGAELGSGQKLWKLAKKIIPGGNMLLSKRAEMFLPEQWPAYFSKAKGCIVWDLDGNEYIDMSIMGIGTNILGYGHPEVDEAVRTVLANGNMCTLNCPEEVYLAELLVELHPWSDMVRFARTGGEANAIAIRIARAATGKDKVAICGYHGWHDWYLAANLGDGQNLDGHLMPGLEPKGVPTSLRGTTLPFNYNQIDELEKLIADHDIGLIMMEVSRSTDTEEGFLKNVRKLSTDNGIILIFDECTSGFRETFGGLHKKYCVDPDMALFGKALGNGYAITAIIGRREIMEAGQNTFISSTFWTERIGPTAGLKTLEIMEREKSWEVITEKGKYIGERWRDLAKNYNLPIECSGLPSLINFCIPVENWLKYKTLITQEMLKRGFLASNSVFVCIEHEQKIINQYFENLNPVFAMIAECEAGSNIDEFLEGPVCHTGFKRLN